MSVDASGGVPEVLAEASPRSRRGFGRPSLLPGGRHLLVATWAEPAGDSIGIYSLNDGETRLLIEDARSPIYAPTGHLVFQRGPTLFAAPFDLYKREVVGAAIPMGLVELGFDLAKDGTLAYHARRDSAGTLVWVDRQGNDEPLFDRDAGFVPYAALSPDERQLAVVSGGDDGLDIWVLDLQSNVLSRLTFGRSVHPRWSPDGAEIFHAARIGGTFHVFSVSTQGGQPRNELVREAYSGPSSVTPDGSTLFYRALGRGWDIGAVSLDGEGESTLLMATSYDEHSPTISPDGSQLAYVSNETGRPEVYLTPYPELEGRRQISNAGGGEPVWSRDGTELFYRNADKMMSVAIALAPELRIGEPELLFERPYGTISGSPGSSYDVTSDGRFVMIKQVVKPEDGRIDFVLNWFQELERLVPTSN